MAALFVDLDGTTFFYGTNTFVPGAYDQLKAFYDSGNELIFTTARGRMWNAMNPVDKYLKELFPSCIILFNVSSPRIVLNDEGAFAINHTRDSAWNYDLFSYGE